MVQLYCSINHNGSINSQRKPKRANVRIGTSNDGRTIEIHFSEDGIHGFPIY